MKSIVQFLWVCGTMIMLLAGIELIKGHTLAEALPFAIGWGLLSSAIFVGSRYYQARKGVGCAACGD
jgi:hypothetical protein